MAASTAATLLCRGGQRKQAGVAHGHGDEHERAHVPQQHGRDHRVHGDHGHPARAVAVAAALRCVAQQHQPELGRGQREQRERRGERVRNDVPGTSPRLIGYGPATVSGPATAAPPFSSARPPWAGAVVSRPAGRSRSGAPPARRTGSCPVAASTRRRPAAPGPPRRPVPRQENHHEVDEQEPQRDGGRPYRPAHLNGIDARRPGDQCSRGRRHQQRGRRRYEPCAAVERSVPAVAAPRGCARPARWRWRTAALPGR